MPSCWLFRHSPVPCSPALAPLATVVAGSYSRAKPGRMTLVGFRGVEEIPVLVPLPGASPSHATAGFSTASAEGSGHSASWGVSGIPSSTLQTEGLAPFLQPVAVGLQLTNLLVLALWPAEQALPVYHQTARMARSTWQAGRLPGLVSECEDQHWQPPAWVQVLAGPLASYGASGETSDLSEPSASALVGVLVGSASWLRRGGYRS